MKRLILDGSELKYTDAESDNTCEEQKENETQKDFLARAGVGVIYSISPEISALNQGLMLLDKKLDKFDNIDKFIIKAVGGFALYNITNNATTDIDTIVAIDERVKKAISDIASNTTLNLEDRWLNDEVLNVKGFGDTVTKRMLKRLMYSDSDFKVVVNNIPKFKHIVLMCAKPSAIAVMKIGAILSREKHKDKDDLLKLCKAKQWDACKLWNFMARYGVQDCIEKSEFASLLFEVGVIETSEDYVKFLD